MHHPENLIVILILAFATSVVDAFVVVPQHTQLLSSSRDGGSRARSATSSSANSRNGGVVSSSSNICSSSRSLTPVTTTTTRLFQSRKKAADGTGRGAYILGAVLVACVWIFSIPPEFRRAYLCGSERCVQNRSAYLCNDCMTPDEWKEGVMNYYRNGGGVKFDFSVDPNSKMKF